MEGFLVGGVLFFLEKTFPCIPVAGDLELRVWKGLGDPSFYRQGNSGSERGNGLPR